MIKVENLEKKYKKITAVDGINLNIDEGEIFGLLGPNGAGKSTTISSLLGILKTSNGEIEIMGRNIAKEFKKVKPYIGYVPQDFAFFEQLSALDNVTYWAKIYGYRKAQLKKVVQEALEYTGLWDRRNDRAKTYSGGMKRRLNIACGIVHKPKILFMDEPTAGVDPQSRNNILESVRDLQKNGTTIIYTSHYMEEVEAICDRVAIMDFGKIIATGTVKELIDSYTKDNTIVVEVEEVSEKINGIISETEGIISIESNENTYTVKTKKDDTCFSKLAENLINNKVHLLSVEVHKPNLETVFLELTGKQLRE